MTLYERIHAMFPNAEPMWFGRPSMDSAIIDTGDGTIVVTNGGDGYDVGLYSGDAWQQTTGADVMLVIRTADDVVRYLDDLTELMPEGVDWWAWAVQWSKDAFSGCDQ